MERLEELAKLIKAGCESSVESLEVIGPSQAVLARLRGEYQMAPDVEIFSTRAYAPISSRLFGTLAGTAQKRYGGCRSRFDVIITVGCLSDGSPAFGNSSVSLQVSIKRAYIQREGLPAKRRSCEGDWSRTS